MQEKEKQALKQKQAEIEARKMAEERRRDTLKVRTPGYTLVELGLTIPPRTRSDGSDGETHLLKNVASTRLFMYPSFCIGDLQ